MQIAKQSPEDKKRKSDSWGLLFGVILAVASLGMIANMAAKSEMFAEPDPIPYQLALPMPPLPEIGKGFSDTTPVRHIVIVQAPPQGRRRGGVMDEWKIGTPETMASSMPSSEVGRFHKPEEPFPAIGSISWHTTLPYAPASLAEVTFEDRTGDQRRKLLRIRSVSGDPIADLYLQGGQTRLRLPIGRYNLSVAMGRKWEGQKTMFGPYGSYFELDPMELTLPANQVLYTRVLGIVPRNIDNSEPHGIKRVAPAKL